MSSRYQLGICEIYNSRIHGYTNRSCKNIDDGTYIVYWTIDLYSLYSNEYKDVITLLVDGYYIYVNNTRDTTKHNTIRNYSNIIKDKNYIKLDIIEVIMNDTGETTAILKTFWLRIFQKKWKKYYCELIKKINLHKKIKNRVLFEINGCILR
jgi:hypothetical protein